MGTGNRGLFYGLEKQATWWERIGGKMEEIKNDELMLFDHPTLPDLWSYEESVKKMQRLMYKWKNLTRDVANELWVAREKLSSRYHRDDGANAPSWGQYCQDVGVAKSTANRWLNKWFPESLTLEKKPLITKAHYSEWLPQQDLADLLLTDPPYSTDIDDVYSFASDWMPLAFDRIKSTGRAYVCIGAYPDEMKAYLTVAERLPLRLMNILVWTYQNTLGPSPSYDYKLNWQAVLYFRGSDAPPIKCPSMVEQFTVQQINAPDARQGDRYHEWQKPLDLANRFILHATNEQDVVIDPFVGTGTFILAANERGRVGFGCDIDDTALDIAIKRGCGWAKQ